MAAPSKDLIKRLMWDLEELKRCLVANVSATPLEDNMLEWHCNIRQDETIYHLVLFFPQNYPYSSPRAEFVSTGFSYRGGASWKGQKGTGICLDIFTDNAASRLKRGWSPAYTVQTILMNVVSFLSETGSYLDPELSKSYECPDCGHNYDKPCPPLDGAGLQNDHQSTSSTSNTRVPEIIDYISKETLKLQKPTSVDEIYGYGLVVSGPSHRPALTTPCEFLSGRSFYGMREEVNVVCSVLKEQLSFFMPLFIHPEHGSGIKEEFEICVQNVARILPSCKGIPLPEMVLKTIPNLMSATVVEFSKGVQHTSDNSLHGYFALHRLFLWALETYPELQDLVDSKLQRFIENVDNRNKMSCPHIGELLMLLAASKKYTWQDLGEAYVGESFKRNVMWYVKGDSKLGFLDTDKEYRLKHTLERTVISRKLLAFQVLFLGIALPKGMTREKVIARYDANMGFPSKDMVSEMKAACFKINNQMNNFEDWFDILKITAPTEDELFLRLMESVYYAKLTPGYHWSVPKGGKGWFTVLRKFRPSKEGMYLYFLRNPNKFLSTREQTDNGGKVNKKADGETPMDVDAMPSIGDTKTKKPKITSSRGKSATRSRKRRANDGGHQAVPNDMDDEDGAGTPAKVARGRGRGKRPNGRGAKRR